MSLKEYRVGLVVARCGLTDRQLTEISRNLRMISQVLTEDGHVLVRVPGFTDVGPAFGVAEAVLKLRGGKVRMEPYAFKAGHNDTAARIIADMEDFKADEVWCCPEQTHFGKSAARTNQVYALGVKSPLARPGQYKKIPPWKDEFAAPLKNTRAAQQKRKAMKGPLW